MPTGYTAAIEEGCTFEEFVWGCARAFGALAMMRDDPSSERVPERFEPSDYYAKALRRAKDELDRLAVMTQGEVMMAIAKERAETLAINARYAAEWSEKEARYQEILTRVQRWEPPSTDHENLKQFMIEQIRISRDAKPYQQDLPESDPAVWLANKKQQAQRDWEYYQKANDEEIVRTDSRNRWIQQLRESVPQPRHDADRD